MKPVVIVPEPIHQEGLDLLRAECDCVVPWQGGAEQGSDAAGARPAGVRELVRGGEHSAIRQALYDADAVIVRLFKISEWDLSRAKRLKVIAKHGTGVDNIDCKAATARRIPVVYTPTANANAVAEHTLALMLALSRQIAPADGVVREGRFSERSRFKGAELAGKTLLVVGLGRIGSRVARIAAQGLGMQVCAYDPLLPAEIIDSGPVTIEDSLEALLPTADYLTIHVPLTADTKHLINAKTLALMRPSCRLVNTSRGAVIDELALAAALSEGTLAGAALDVFEEEPLPADHPLCRAPNTLLTPHISSSTAESLERMSLFAAQGVLDVLHGRVPKHVVNPEVFE